MKRIEINKIKNNWNELINSLPSYQKFNIQNAYWNYEMKKNFVDLYKNGTKPYLCWDKGNMGSSVVRVFEEDKIAKQRRNYIYIIRK